MNYTPTEATVRAKATRPGAVFVADEVRVVLDALTAAATRLQLSCGHPAELLIQSVESDYRDCELCEALKMRNDAITMEHHYKAELAKAATRLQQLQEAQTCEACRGTQVVPVWDSARPQDWHQQTCPVCSNGAVPAPPEAR